MKLLVLDNYDSFTYNLVHIIRELGYKPEVFRNDAISLEEVTTYDKIVLSPGPGIPEEAGILLALIKQYAPTKPMLGVCLGHQAIGLAFGSTLYNLPEVLHGISLETIVKEQDYLFKGLPEKFIAGRYHSWVINKNELSDELLVTATDNAGEIMGIRHKKYPIHGLQFHPESIMTEYGKQMIQNWLEA